MQTVNLLSVVFAAVLGWLFGGLWFQPFAFGPTWQKLLLTKAEDRKKGQKRALLSTIVIYLFIAYALAMYLKALHLSGVTDGALQGLLMGVCFAATNGSVLTLFRAEPFKLFFIEYGGQVATMALMGAIVGIWA
jgi:hypothetical protein